MKVSPEVYRRKSHCAYFGFCSPGVHNWFVRCGFPDTVDMLKATTIVAFGFVLAIAADTDSPLFAQTTVATGSIVGTVSDSSKAFISGGKITITNTATAHAIEVTTNSYGAFDSGALIPGDYKAVVSAKGFGSARSTVTVLVGNTITLNVTLQIGEGKEVVEVEGSPVQVNSEQATVQGVLTEQQIENLPINGRDFLELAQLEPVCRFRMPQISALARTGFRPFHSADVSAAPLVSKWMAWTFPTRSSVRQRPTFRRVPFRSSSSANQVWISRQN